MYSAGVSPFHQELGRMTVTRISYDSKSKNGPGRSQRAGAPEL
jgi:hypothetical protein